MAEQPGQPGPIGPPTDAPTDAQVRESVSACFASVTMAYKRMNRMEWIQFAQMVAALFTLIGGAFAAESSQWRIVAAVVLAAIVAGFAFGISVMRIRMSEYQAAIHSAAMMSAMGTMETARQVADLGIEALRGAGARPDGDRPR